MQKKNSLENQMSKKEDEKKIIDSIVSGEISESPVRNKYNAKE